MTRTEYKVEIKTAEGFERNFATTNKDAANNRAKDLAAAGYDGRIVTGTGRVVQEWTVEK